MSSSCNIICFAGTRASSPIKPRRTMESHIPTLRPHPSPEHRPLNPDWRKSECVCLLLLVFETMRSSHFPLPSSFAFEALQWNLLSLPHKPNCNSPGDDREPCVL